MTKFEAVLHYGITRKERPTAAQIRDLFFAAVLAGQDGSEDTTELATVLMKAYIAAWELDHEEEEELVLLDFEEAEEVFHAAYVSAYGGEPGDGLGWFEFLSGEARQWRIYPRQLMIDTGHLLALFEASQQKAFAEYMKSEAGRQRLGMLGVLDGK